MGAYDECNIKHPVLICSLLYNVPLKRLISLLNNLNDVVLMDEHVLQSVEDALEYLLSDVSFFDFPLYFNGNI
jgi:hypothetical protein